MKICGIAFIFKSILVTKDPIFSCFVAILKRLHWLPVKFRIHFKIYVDEPALASIMTYGHAKDLCASELGPLRIYAL